VQDLLHAGLSPLVQLSESLRAWSLEIAAMWRFTRNNGITEGFHNTRFCVVNWFWVPGLPPLLG
jgi:hypothetical protein